MFEAIPVRRRRYSGACLSTLVVAAALDTGSAGATDRQRMWGTFIGGCHGGPNPRIAFFGVARPTTLPARFLGEDNSLSLEAARKAILARGLARRCHRPVGPDPKIGSPFFLRRASATEWVRKHYRACLVRFRFKRDVKCIWLKPFPITR